MIRRDRDGRGCRIFWSFADGVPHQVNGLFGRDVLSYLKRRWSHGDSNVT